MGSGVGNTTLPEQSVESSSFRETEGQNKSEAPVLADFTDPFSCLRQGETSTGGISGFSWLTKGSENKLPYVF